MEKKKETREEKNEKAVGLIFKFFGKQVKVIEQAPGFVDGRDAFWVQAFEASAGYEIGEEFIVSGNTVRKNLK
jgi:hypothetical protein